jgi:hypothetical protein
MSNYVEKPVEDAIFVIERILSSADANNRFNKESFQFTRDGNILLLYNMETYDSKVYKEIENAFPDKDVSFQVSQPAGVKLIISSKDSPRYLHVTPQNQQNKKNSKKSMLQTLFEMLMNHVSSLIIAAILLLVYMIFIKTYDVVHVQ